MHNGSGARIIFYSDFTQARIGDFLNRTTGVECPHRELRAGFPDGLRGNDTHSFTDADKHVRRQIVSVAFGADTFLSLAGEH